MVGAAWTGSREYRIERLNPATASGWAVPLRSDTSQRWFLVAVFAGIAIVIGTSFAVYSLQVPRPVRTDNLVFTPASLLDGNASFEVLNVSHGPYAYSGFEFRFIVNNFAIGPVALGPNHTATRIALGTTTYWVSWLDTDGDGAVSVGDSFLVTGDRAPLSPLSDYEFDLQWGNAWAARVFWSTY